MTEGISNIETGFELREENARSVVGAIHAAGLDVVP